MKSVSIFVLIAALVAVPTTPAATADSLDSASFETSATSADLLSGLTTRAEVTSGYSRDLFGDWIDADGDGCNTRAEVLQAETLAPLTYSSGCSVSTGLWYSEFDGLTWTLASDVDIDHMVPLSEAWASGANAWTASQRRAFANDLGLDASLIAVTDNVNQSKGDRDPASWLPPLKSAHCSYVNDWIAVKARWKLAVDTGERTALQSVLNSGCTLSAAPDASDPGSGGGSGFSDVTSSTPFAKEIQWLASTGITNGYSDGTFKPQAPVNRDAMAAFLYRLAGSPSFTPPSSSPFSDVTPKTPFYKEITWLASTKITGGYSDGTYRPLTSVNRDAMAAFMYRFVGQPAFTPSGTSPFIDVSTSYPFYKQIAWLASEGISTGSDVGDGCRRFAPLESVNRDAMAAFMYRLELGGTTPVVGGTCSPSSPTPPPTSPEPEPEPAPIPANPGDSKNCGDFATQREAQAWYDRYFPYYGDIARLDGNDNDGIVCESLP